MPSGDENTQCVILRLGNAEQRRVGAIHKVLGEATHHCIVYRTNDTVERTEPFDCERFVDTLDPTKGSPLMITQRADELLELPEGVAFSLEPNQMIRALPEIGQKLDFIPASNNAILCNIGFMQA